MSKPELSKLLQLCRMPETTSCSGLSQVMSATAIKLDDESLHVSAVLASCCPAFINECMYSSHLKGHIVCTAEHWMPLPRLLCD